MSKEQKVAEICLKFEGKNFISLPGSNCCFLDLASLITIVPEGPDGSVIKWPPDPYSERYGEN
jgi:hypothetical protein